MQGDEPHFEPATLAHFQPGLPPQNWGSRNHRVICDPKTPVNTALKPHGTGKGTLPLARAVAGISFLEDGVVSTDRLRQQIGQDVPPVLRGHILAQAPAERIQLQG